MGEPPSITIDANHPDALKIVRHMISLAGIGHRLTEKQQLTDTLRYMMAWRDANPCGAPEPVVAEDE